MRFFISSISIFFGLIHGKTIRFFKGDGCDHSESPSVQCGNVDIPGCCTADAPFCKFLECIDCAGGNDVYAYDQRGCRIQAKNSCRIGADAECCVGAGGGKGCAGNWFRGGGHGFSANEADTVAAQYNGTEPVPWELLPKSQVHPDTGQLLPEGCIGLIEPNYLIYHDGDSIRHSKYIPKGAFRQSMGYLEELNWAELAKLPAWGKYNLV